MTGPQDKDEKPHAEKPPPEKLLKPERMDVYMVNGTPILVQRTEPGTEKKANDGKRTEETLDSYQCSNALLLSGSAGNIKVFSSKVVHRSMSPLEAKKRWLILFKKHASMRIFIYFINSMVQVINLASLNEVADSPTSDAELNKFLSMKYRYFTTWVVILHIFYSFCAQILDVIAKNIKCQEPDHSANVYLIKAMYPFGVILRSIIWPSSLVTTTVFWSMYYFGKEPVLPEYFEKYVSGTNHIMHTWITVFVFVDSLVRPRCCLHRNYRQTDFRVMFYFLALYMSVFYYTVLIDGIWLYPMFSAAFDNGLIPFFLLHLGLIGLFFFYYAIMWFVSNYKYKNMMLLKNEIQVYRIRWGNNKHL